MLIGAEPGWFLSFFWPTNAKGDEVAINREPHLHMESKMRFLFAMVALFAIDLSASTVEPLRSMTFNLGGIQSDFPKDIHLRLREEIANRVKVGAIHFYREELMFNNSARICVEASEEVLLELPSFLEEFPMASQANITIDAKSSPCPLPHGSEHVLR